MTEPLARVVVDHAVDPSRTIVRLIGEIDATTAPWVATQLNEAADPSGELTIDLTGISYIGSQGMSALQSLADRHHRGSLELKLIADPADIVWRLIAITGLDKAVPVLPSTTASPRPQEAPDR